MTGRSGYDASEKNKDLLLTQEFSARILGGKIVLQPLLMKKRSPDRRPDPFMPRVDDLQKRFVNDLNQLDLSKACLEDGHAGDQVQVYADRLTVLCRAMPLVSLGKGVVFPGKVMYTIYMTCDMCSRFVGCQVKC